MALLRQAVQKGYQNVAHMKKDADLDALRDRDDRGGGGMEKDLAPECP